MRLTTKTIIATAAKKTGVNADYIELVHSNDGYHWAGKAGSVFIWVATYKRISDVSLERWIEDFEYRVEEVMESHGMSKYENLNAYIESLDWSIE
jgi:hypothetical protein